MRPWVDRMDADSITLRLESGAAYRFASEISPSMPPGVHRALAKKLRERLPVLIADLAAEVAIEIQGRPVSESEA